MRPERVLRQWAVQAAAQLAHLADILRESLGDILRVAQERRIVEPALSITRAHHRPEGEVQNSGRFRNPKQVLRIHPGADPAGVDHTVAQQRVLRPQQL